MSEADPKRELRDLVFRELVKYAGAHPSFKALVEPLGFFSVVELVDGICDCIETTQAESRHHLAVLLSEEASRVEGTDQEERLAEGLRHAARLARMTGL